MHAKSMSYSLFCKIVLLFSVLTFSACAETARVTDDIPGNALESAVEIETSTGPDSGVPTNWDGAISNDVDRGRDGEAVILEFSDARVDGDASSEPVYIDRINSGCVWKAVFPELGAQNLHAVWGSAADDVYAVGDLSTLLHYDGNRWTAVAIDINADFLNVWGSGKNDVYVTGVLRDARGEKSALPIILHFDGRGWSKVDVTESYCYLSANNNFFVGTSQNNVFIIGNCGQIWHFDGSIWNAASPEQTAFNWLDLFACGSNEVYATAAALKGLYRFDALTSQFRITD
jgi:hypothetical protein